MDFQKLLDQRRSIRNYEDKEVSTDLIKEVIKDSVKAPNGMNLQLWRFIIVKDKKFIKRIAVSREQAVLNDLEKNPTSPFKFMEARIKSGDFHPFYNAPALVLIAGQSDARMLAIDSGILAGFFMLSAADHGLGTCFASQGLFIDDKDIRKELAIPDNFKIYGSIIIGYPNETPQFPGRKEPEIIKVIS